MTNVKRSSLISADGTKIVYREEGKRPSVILLHGAMQASEHFATLAHELSPAFRLYVPDCRGRGGSGPFGNSYGLVRER
jgi:pimeloyl-ACP methyl ester carboxylesterase